MDQRNGEPIADVELSIRSTGVGGVAGPQEHELQTPQTAQNRFSVVIASTFTADPVLHPLQFWMKKLAIPAGMAMAPYGQIMQQMLDPSSLFSNNKSGVNVLLMRLDDWFRQGPSGDSVERNIAHLRAAARELAEAARALRTRTSTPLLVILCPPSTFLPAAYGQPLEEIQRDLRARLSAAAHVHCWTHADLIRLYHVSEYQDERSDRIGHIPYTDEYFTAIATLLARRIAALVKPAYKVIAVDCDNTLWKGVCGEDGAVGVELTRAHLHFQRMLVQQYEAGMLLCLCSKNNEYDVEAVFMAHPEMPLHKDHLITSRVNWNSKSSNLRSLAEELELSLDSFIMVDDSAIECAEVQANAPGVLVLRFPEVGEEIMHFVAHVWAFDRVEITQDAKKRTAQYRENFARSRARKEADGLEEFLASLQLRVEVSAMRPEELTRVAELIQRTNQFNLTGIRRRSNELEAMVSSGALRSIVVHVCDRFGDYGLVGALLFRSVQSSLQVDTFVLSCRALGRGVEHRIVNALAMIARDEGVSDITLRYRPTARNVPAREFLSTSFERFRKVPPDKSGSSDEEVFVVPLDYASKLGVRSLTSERPTEDAESAKAGVASQTPSIEWHEIAFRLSKLPDIVRELARATSSTRESSDVEYVAPRTPIEEAVAEIWAAVLGYRKVSVRADFFELGGDSLLAVRAIARIGSMLGLELSIYDFFDAPTVEDVAGKLEDASQAALPISSTAVGLLAPLSWAQQRIWFIDQLEGGSVAYHIPVALRLSGRLHEESLRAALSAILRRHESLRTTFVNVDGKPAQVIAVAAQFELRYVDLSSHTPQARDTELIEQSRQEIAAPFDLARGPMIRGKLLRISLDEHVLFITMHHIVSDGWSIGVFIRELAALYKAEREGQSSLLPSLPIQYRDYAQWQRQSIGAAELTEHLAYWKQHLQGSPELLELPTDRPRPAVQSYQGSSVDVHFEPTFSAELKAFSRHHNLTLAMTLYTAWAIVLARLSGQGDIVVGMPVANRRRTEIEDLIGLFVNTLAIRVRLGSETTVVELLGRVKETMLDAFAHQDVPFEQVVEALQPVRTRSHSPIFQVMFVLQNPSGGQVSSSGLTISEQSMPLLTAQFDLVLSLRETVDGLTGSLNYASDLFNSTTIAGWVECLKSVLREVVQEPDLQVDLVSLMSEQDRRMVVELFNATQGPYAHEKLMHQLIEEQVSQTPDAIAVTYEDKSLTYGELNVKANRLARFLRGKGVGPDQLVAICVDRSLEMVIGLLGILKAGGAYVPIDPSYPADRRSYMLQNAAPRVLLTQRHLRDRAEGTCADTIELDGDWEKITMFDGSNLDAASIGLTSRHLAYVIYTSGSTGLPKGAMNEHRALVNRLQWMQRQYQLDEFDRVLQKTPFSFDVSVWEFFWTLMCGARLVVARPQGHQDPYYLQQLIEAAGVTRLHFVPSMLQIFLDRYQQGSCGSLSHIICSGEELTPALQNKCLQLLPRTRLSNLYGPTEAAIDVTAWECTYDTAANRIPIGRPIANVQIYVLDGHSQPVPVGVVGEIFIGGVGVGRGYWNRPDLTAERFVTDPFSADPTARLYKTGDLGRWRADGAVEYLGRNDHQVKIRGLRIELGEVEAQLARHERVKEVAVIARADAPGEKRLVAYVVPDLLPPKVEELRAHLMIVLPEYMVPSAFVIIDRLPLSPNGKLDRRALPTPEFEAYISRQYEPPSGAAEEILSEIWRAVLRVERIGRRDNFFELGGHSLLVVQMMDHLRRAGFSAQVRDVFDRPTLADLAAALRQGGGVQIEIPPNLIPNECTAITPQMLPLVELAEEDIERIVQRVPGGPANIEDVYPLAPLQEGILFHHMISGQEGDAYVASTLLSVASQERLQELLQALQGAIDRHDVLRTAILWDDLPRPLQVVYRRATLQVTQTVLDPAREVTEQLAEWMAPHRQRLDLRRAPLLRLQTAPHPNDGHWYVLVQFHHIVGDNESREAMIAEIVAALNGHADAFEQGVPYRSHVAQGLAYARSHDAEAFFRSKLADIDEPTAPFAILDVHRDGSQVREAQLSLESELARKIRACARRLGVSAATLFHAGWGLVVAHTSGRTEVVFGSVLLGRLQSSAGARRALGMFINTLPLRLQLKDISTRELVEHTHRELVELLSHEQASLSVAQRCSGVPAAAPLFTALLNYRHDRGSANASWADAKGIKILATHDRTNYPINMSVDDLGDGFALSAQTDLRIDAHRMVGYLRTVMQSLVDALEERPQEIALSLCILSEFERSQVIESFNATRVEFPRTKLIHELFEEQVAQQPEAIATVYEDQQLAYRQLNQRANQLAHALLQRGVRPDDRVGLCVDRGIEMVVGLLGILKAGGAYVPLDSSYPAERLNYMLTDSAPLLVVTQERLRRVLPAGQFEVIAIDTDHAALEAGPVGNPDAGQLGLTPRHLASIIYTSGSTGMPKGVMVEHVGLCNLAYVQRHAFDVTPHSRVLQFASLSFDACTWEWVMALCNGARLCLASRDDLTPGAPLVSVLREQEITHATLPPVALGALPHCDELSLRTLIVAGEACPPAVAQKWAEGLQFINGYGPTEATVCASMHQCEPPVVEALPIGRPIANAQIYILDHQRAPVPIGVAGEIHVGGVGVTRGYLGQPQLTEQRFIVNPFIPGCQDRLYKTGDMGRWRADGTIEFLGRNDSQVKIRGFRIECGEIETQLVRHANVREAVVVAREDVEGDRRLVAYLTWNAHSSLVVEQLRAFLRQQLPEHMVPSAFVVLENLPLTPSGKVDRRALPVPSTEAYASCKYDPPLGRFEEELSSIWRQVLQVDAIGRQANFFELGGHSLLAVKALLRINQAFGCTLRVTDLYRNPVLHELAARVSGNAAEDEFVDLSTEAALDAAICAPPGDCCVPPRHILLTGATGFVGRFLLSELLVSTDAIIHCIVRAQSNQQARVRVKMTLLKWDLWRDDFEQRIVALRGDLSLPRLGLDEGIYERLASDVDSIYHNAASMNHLETYPMAKPANVDAAKELSRLAARGRPKLINYISSLSVFHPSDEDTLRIVNEESPIEFEKHSIMNGYVASKWVGEKIFMNAVERGVRCNIFRVGLVWADTLQGRYDELQQGYRIFKSCLLSGFGIRNYKYQMAPTPVDYVARAVVYLASRRHDGGGIFHISSSRQSIAGLFERCNDIAGTSLELLPHYEWIREMKRLHLEGRLLPAVPLIEFAFSMDEESFYEHQSGLRSQNIRFDCAQTQRELEAAGIVAPALDDEALRLFVHYLIARDFELQQSLGFSGSGLTGRHQAGSRRDLLSRSGT